MAPVMTTQSDLRRMVARPGGLYLTPGTCLTCHEGNDAVTLLAAHGESQQHVARQSVALRGSGCGKQHPARDHGASHVQRPAMSREAIDRLELAHGVVVPQDLAADSRIR